MTFSLAQRASPGSLRMIWHATDGSEDDGSPHEFVLAPDMEVAGEHTFEMERFGLVVEDVDEVSSASSGGAGRKPTDLVRGTTYNVTLVATPAGCNGTIADSHSVRRWDMLWVFGVLASLVSSAGSTVGMLIQKCAITRNERKIKLTGKGAPVVCGFTCTIGWWVGFIFMVVIPLPFDIISLALCGQVHSISISAPRPQSWVVVARCCCCCCRCCEASDEYSHRIVDGARALPPTQSLQAPLGGVSVLLNQIIAPCVLEKETLTRLDWLATFGILLGVTISTAFGTHNSVTYTLDELLDLLQEPMYLGWSGALWLGFIFPAMAVVHFRSKLRMLTGKEQLGSKVEVCRDASKLDSEDAEWELATIRHQLEDGTTDCVPIGTTLSAATDETPRGWAGLTNPQVRLPVWQHMHLVFAFLAGAIGAQQNVLLKASAEMTETLFNGDTR